jgi:hypothetical protein
MHHANNTRGFHGKEHCRWHWHASSISRCSAAQRQEVPGYASGDSVGIPVCFDAGHLEVGEQADDRLGGRAEARIGTRKAGPLCISDAAHIDATRDDHQPHSFSQHWEQQVSVERRFRIAGCGGVRRHLTGQRRGGVISPRSLARAS